MTEFAEVSHLGSTPLEVLPSGYGMILAFLNLFFPFTQSRRFSLALLFWFHGGYGSEDNFGVRGNA